MTNAAFQSALRYCRKVAPITTSQEYRIFLEYAEAARDNLPGKEYRVYLGKLRLRCIQNINNSRI